MNKNPYIDFIKKYKDEPNQFVKDVLSVHPDEWQAEFLSHIAGGERKISVRSGHGTGKSTAASWAMVWYLTTRFPCKIVVTAPTSSQLFDALFAELKSWIRNLPPYVGELFEVTSDRVVLKAAPSEAFISARTARAETPEALAGVHSQNVLLVCDEASGIDEKVFEAASGSMSGHSATTVLLGNPTRSSGLFYDTHHRVKADWKTMHVSCLKSPRVSDEFVREMEVKYGAESNQFRVRVLGEFPLKEDNTVISADTVQSAQKRDIESDPDTVPIWGLDVARFGADSSVLAIRHGNAITELISWKGLSLMELTGRVVDKFNNLIPRQRPTEILVDSIGLGAGVVDRLQELDLPVRGINVGEASSMSGTYLNLRAELWFKLKDWLAAKDCKLPVDSALFSELVSPRYQFTSSGKMKIESKDEMRKRGLPSPDKADAICLTLASDAATATFGSKHSVQWKKPLKRAVKGVV
jgi:phage terminase large subunit